MKITQINSNAQNFKQLNIKSLSAIDKQNFVQGNISKLKELGNKYDIRMVSCYSDIPGFSSIDINVKPLGKGFNFMEKLFFPTGRSTFKTGYTYIDETLKTKKDFMKAVHDAIQDLHKKL